MSSNTCDPVPHGLGHVVMVAYTDYAWDPRVRNEAEMLARKGYSVEVIALRPSGQATQLTQDSLRVTEIPLTARKGSKARYAFQYIVFLLLSSAALLRIHLRRRVGLVHVHSLPDFEVFSALPLLAGGVPVILDLHEALPEIVAARFTGSTKSPLCRMAAVIEQVSCRFATHVIAANDGIRDAVVSRGQPPAHITTVYTPIDRHLEYLPEGDVIRELDLPQGRYLVYAGGINQERDLETYIGAFGCAATPRNLSLVVAGEGEPAYVKQLKELAESINVADRVRFVGRLARKDVLRLVSRSELGVVTLADNPLTQIAWPNRIAEFAAFNKPLVLPDLRFIRSFVGTGAVYYKPGDPQSLAEGLRAILATPERLHTSAEAASRLAKRLSYDQTSMSLDKVYRTALSHTGPEA